MTFSLADFRTAVAALLARSAFAEPERTRAPQSVSEQIVEEVKRLINDGVIKPGARIFENDLATRFGVSRAPVRDALRMLDKEGFVELTARRGAQVHQPDARDITHLYEIRAELFALGARKAAGRLDAEGCALVEKGLSLISAMAEDESVTAADFMEARAGLAVIILQAGGNPRLFGLIENLRFQAMTHSRVFANFEHRRVNAGHWRVLIAAVTSGDSEAAAAGARDLVLSSRDELIRQMQQAQAA